MNDDALHGHPEAMRAMARMMSELGMSVNESVAKTFTRLQGMAQAGEWDDRNHRRVVEQFAANGKVLNQWMRTLDEQIAIITKMAGDYENALRR
jgi:uncharacterized MAPEG superfamily protein